MAFRWWLFAYLLIVVAASSEEARSMDDDQPDFVKYLKTPSPGPVVNEKYRPYIPESYRDYIPRMDESGVQYQKYMQGEPDAKKFQDKVLPQGAYQQEIPLSQGAASTKSDAPQVLAAAEAKAKEDSKDAHANKANTDTDPGFMKYLHAPSPGPVVNKKYRPYIPESYRDYIPRMDESGVQYQKYIQGEPDAKKFQDKVLPQGAYQQEIPLSQGAASAANAEPAVVLSSEQQATEEADGPAAALHLFWVSPFFAIAAVLGLVLLATALRARATTQHTGLSESLIV